MHVIHIIYHVLLLLSVSDCAGAFVPSHRIALAARVRHQIQRPAANEDPQDEPHSGEDTIVTKEMFLRELLRHPNDDDNDHDDGVGIAADTAAAVTVKRQSSNKKGRGKDKSYKVLDNRDSLPFAVTVATPDPYTHPEIKKEKARKQSVTPKKRHDAVESAVSSSLFVQSSAAVGGGKKKKKDNGSEMDTSTWLGDFVLDKLTTTGDILEIGDKQYKVVKHRCQYKYAGGKRFVMTRKILQVKEVSRLRTEEYLKAQLSGSERLSEANTFPVEER